MKWDGESPPIGESSARRRTPHPPKSRAIKESVEELSEPRLSLVQSNGSYVILAFEKPEAASEQWE